MLSCMTGERGWCVVQVMSSLAERGVNTRLRSRRLQEEVDTHRLILLTRYPTHPLSYESQCPHARLCAAATHHACVVGAPLITRTLTLTHTSQLPRGPGPKQGGGASGAGAANGVRRPIHRRSAQPLQPGATPVREPGSASELRARQSSCCVECKGSDTRARRASDAWTPPPLQEQHQRVCMGVRGAWCRCGG